MSVSKEDAESTFDGNIAGLLYELAREIGRQNVGHPSGYPATRDGVFLGIQTAIHELEVEAMHAWRNGRCKCPEPECSHHDWSGVRVELVQAAAVILRTLRELDPA